MRMPHYALRMMSRWKHVNFSWFLKQNVYDIFNCYIGVHKVVCVGHELSIIIFWLFQFKKLTYWSLKETLVVFISWEYWTVLHYKGGVWKRYVYLMYIYPLSKVDFYAHFAMNFTSVLMKSWFLIFNLGARQNKPMKYKCVHLTCWQTMSWHLK